MLRRVLIVALLASMMTTGSGMIAIVLMACVSGPFIAMLFNKSMMRMTTLLAGVLIGARLSSQAPAGVVRAALVVVLVASALKLFEVPTTLVLVIVGLTTLAAVAEGARRRGRAPSGSQDRDSRDETTAKGAESASGVSPR